MKQTIVSSALLIAALMLTGCAFNVGYNPAYLPGAAQAMGIPGKSLVVVDAADENWVYGAC
jgi:hypothetical protein